MAKELQLCYIKGVNVTFTELFKKECKERFGITEGLVSEVLENPTGHEVIDYKDLSLEFDIKEVGGVYLLVISRKLGEQLEVFLGLKIRKDFIGEEMLSKPNNVLEKLVDRFGLDITIGNFSGKYAVAQDIKILPGQVSNLVSFKNPANHSFLSSMLIKVNNQMTEVECAQAFILDTDEYGRWLSSSTKDVA